MMHALSISIHPCLISLYPYNDILGLVFPDDKFLEKEYTQNLQIVQSSVTVLQYYTNVFYPLTTRIQYFF